MAVWDVYCAMREDGVDFFSHEFARWTLDSTAPATAPAHIERVLSGWLAGSVGIYLCLAVAGLTLVFYLWAIVLTTLLICPTLVVLWGLVYDRAMLVVRHFEAYPVWQWATRRRLLASLLVISLCCFALAMLGFASLLATTGPPAVMSPEYLLVVLAHATAQLRELVAVFTMRH
jgi:hypothetical protein